MKTKRIIKKLSVSKVTVSSLENNGMDHVLGGAYTATCPWSDYNCPSRPPKCTNYPKAACWM